MVCKGGKFFFTLPVFIGYRPVRRQLMFFFSKGLLNFVKPKQGWGKIAWKQKKPVISEEKKNRASYSIRTVKLHWDGHSCALHIHIINEHTLSKKNFSKSKLLLRDRNYFRLSLEKKGYSMFWFDRTIFYKYSISYKQYYNYVGSINFVFI